MQAGDALKVVSLDTLAKSSINAGHGLEGVYDTRRSHLLGEVGAHDPDVRPDVEANHPRLNTTFNIIIDCFIDITKCYNLRINKIMGVEIELQPVLVAVPTKVGGFGLAVSIGSGSYQVCDPSRPEATEGTSSPDECPEQSSIHDCLSEKA
jgi:hypothetical protein